MKLKSILLTAVACSAFAVGSAQANLLISYGGNSLGLFSDTGTLITTYSTTLANPQQVVTDNSGHVYVADFGGSFNGNIKMYNIATGAFVRNVLAGGYNFTGVAFNPANPGEIIATGAYNGANGQVIRATTNTTGNFVAFSTVGVPYSHLAYSASSDLIYAAAAGSVIQSFLPTTLAYQTNVHTIAGGGLVGITTIGSDIYNTGANAGLWSTFKNGLPLANTSNVVNQNLFGLTNDGTNLWSADFGAGGVAKYNASTGSLLSSFALSAPVGIAFTAVPEPSTYALLGLGLLAVAMARRRRRAA